MFQVLESDRRAQQRRDAKAAQPGQDTGDGQEVALASGPSAEAGAFVPRPHPPHLTPLAAKMRERRLQREAQRQVSAGAGC